MSNLSGGAWQDLALLIHGDKLQREHYLSTLAFIEKVAELLRAKLTAEGLA
jgi:isocitrate dehydrogenase